MWNDIKSAKIVKCDTTGEVCIAIGSELIPLGGNGGAGFEYWNGDVSWDATEKKFVFEGLNTWDATYREIEFGVRLNYDSKSPSFAKYSFITENFKDSTNYALNYDKSGSRYPSAQLYCPSSLSPTELRLEASTVENAVSMANPSLVFVRLYPKA